MAKNCTLVYSAGGKAHVFQAWGIAYSHGFELTATESVSRRQRAYYPRRVNPTQFTVTLALKANTQVDRNDRPIAFSSEYDRWGVFMAGYFNYMLELGRQEGSAPTQFPGMMQVTMAGRNFSRYGIPLNTSFGDHLASIFYTPTIMFETAIDPYDPSTAFLTSWVDDQNALTNDKLFANAAYPFSDYAQGTRDESAYSYEQLIDYRISGQDVQSVVNQVTGQDNAPQSFNKYTSTGDPASAGPDEPTNNQPSDGSTTTATTFGGG
jgi:hypothetical protein